MTQIMTYTYRPESKFKVAEQSSNLDLFNNDTKNYCNLCYITSSNLVLMDEGPSFIATFQ